MTIKEIKVKRFFFFGFPFGWFSCCRADKLVIEQESKRRAAREKKSRRGWTNYSSIKRFFFFQFILNWRRPVNLTEWDERQLCLFVLFLSFFLFSFFPSCPSQVRSFRSARGLVWLRVSEWLSWEKHQYQFIHTITHIEQHHTDTHTEFSLQSPVRRMTLWPLEKCRHVITDREETYSPTMSGRSVQWNSEKTKREIFIIYFNL